MTQRNEGLTFCHLRPEHIDQLAELEDSLKYSLGPRTLIELSLIRASRIATTATIEELMKAVRALKSSGAGSAPAAVSAAPVAAPAPATARDSAKVNAEVLADPKVADVLAALPGAAVMGISERRRA